MKRGKALIIALVILLVVSVLSTGNYISFADNLSGGAYSTVGNAIAIVTGNLVATTPGISMQAAQINVATKVHGESCQSATSCLSSTCTGSPKKCKDESWRTITSGFKTGRVCRFDSQCVSGKCLKTFITVNGLPLGLCGKDVENICSLNADCLSGKCSSSSKKCVKSFSGGLCINNADCSSDLKCTSNRCKPAQAQLKANGVSCAANSECTSNLCTYANPAVPAKTCMAPKANGQSCSTNAQCTSNYCNNANPRVCAAAFVQTFISEPAALETNGLPDDGTIEAYDSNLHRVKLKTAIENAINLLKTRLNVIEALHQNQAAGAMVAVTGAQAAGGEDNPRIAGEHCTGKTDCISNNCMLDSGSNQKVCYDPKPISSRIGIRQVGAACNNGDVCVTGYCPGTQLQSKTCKKRPNGLTCDKNTQCTSGKCSNGICGKQRGEDCDFGGIGLCLSNECKSDKCDYSYPKNTPGNAQDLCGNDNDCNPQYKCSNFHRCTTVTVLKNYNAACTYNEQCLSGTCANIKCAKSASGELCETIADCSANYVCNADKRCRIAQKADGSSCTANSECTSNLCTYANPAVPAKTCMTPKTNGQSCNTHAQCASNYCNNANPRRCALKDDGMDCNSDSECSSTFCDPATSKCAALVLAGERISAPEYPDAGAGEAYSGPQTLSDWKAILTTLSTAMQGVEDRICTESFKHPGIETEGLPCSLTGRAQATTAKTSITKSIFSIFLKTPSPSTIPNIGDANP